MWEPSPDNLQTLVVLFRQSNDGSRESRTLRNQARTQLDGARSQPDLVNYLVYLLVNSPPQVPADATESVRATSGLWLKNVLVFDWARLVPENVSYVQQLVTRGLADPNQLIRNASSIVVTTLLAKVGLVGWPTLLPELVQAIDSSTPGDVAQEGAVIALRNICEDSAGLVAQNEDLMAQLVPKLITFTSSPSAKVRSHAISCLTEFVPLGSQAFLVHIDDFLQACFSLAQNDSSADTMSSICRAFSELLTIRPDKLVPHLEGVVQFTLHCLQSHDDNVALEGAEFLLSFAESDADEDTLRPLMPAILPAILQGMVFSDDDLFVIDSMAEDDSNEADRDQDIRPTMPKLKKGHGSSKKDEDDDSDDEEEDMEMSLESWNLRKCCAATLDQLAQKDPQATLEVALPIMLQRATAATEWPVKESAVLAFGAIAQGMQAVGETSYVSELVPYLVELLRSEHAPIREISCWTLSRYSGQQGVEWPVLQGVLNCTMDVNKRVQAAACGALSVLAETSGGELDPYAGELFQHLQRCFSRYQKNNLLSLYECIQTVATSTSAAISADPTVIYPVMEPMVVRWNEVSNEDYELLALLECLGFLAVAMGASFARFAPPLFERSIVLVREGLVLLQRAQIDPLSVDAPEPMVVVCALDLIDGLVQALGDSGTDPLFDAQEQSTQTGIADMLLMCLGLDNLDIKQSALALIGDLAIFNYNTQLLRHLPRLVPEIIAQINTRLIEDDSLYEPVGDNSMWALAEISMHHEKFSLNPWFQDIFQRLGTVLLSPNTHSPNLLSNAATAIGRVGLGSSQLLAPHVGVIISRWLEVIMDVDSTLEKDTALQGMCVSIGANPQALHADTLVEFFKVLAAYFTPSPALKQLVSTLMEGYKNMIPNFNELLGSLPPAFQQQLHASYTV